MLMVLQGREASIYATVVRESGLGGLTLAFSFFKGSWELR
jgi:hypothetical protein